MKKLSVCLSLAGAAVLAGPAAGQVISIDPGSVTASSEIGSPFFRTVDQIVDGSGLAGGQHTTLDPNSTMWLSTGTAFGGDDPDPFVIFDLGEVYTITSIRVWNYNELAGATDLTGRGVNAVTVEYGETNALGSTVAGITSFARANATNSYTGEAFNAFGSFDARYIKFDIDSNHGGDNNFYGLSEVQFTGTPVPEPASLALLGLGGLLMARRRHAAGR